MMGWYNDGIGWFGWILMSFSMIAFWALVVYVVVALLRFGRTDQSQRSRGQEAIDILDQRFARGEIEEPEYRARSEILRTSAHRT
ncbi:SHOCT domain-containing protein [Janibacter terrae]|uniref:SHOCT domain-containing protein n=1 Tax=Janibacter terrae TaxID=103817 RepID=UPI0009EDE4AE|nr:hypothetical protein [Janibacter terrae]